MNCSFPVHEVLGANPQSWLIPPVLVDNVNEQANRLEKVKHCIWVKE